MSSRCIAVCLQKSGTHLLAEVMQHLGFRVCGAVRPNPKIPYGKIEFTPADEKLLLAASEPVKRYQHAMYRLIGKQAQSDLVYKIWMDMFWSWRDRLGVPLKSRYDQHLLIRSLIATKRYSSLGFNSTPENMCWFFPSLPIAGMDGKFIEDWNQEKEPAIIFLVRDPRDMLVSFVDYLLRKTKYGMGTYREYLVYSEILSGIGSYEQQLLYAIRDPLFPGKLAIRESAWLANHASVLTVRYEDLAGARAGGNEDKQRDVLDKLATHVHRPIAMDKAVAACNKTDTFTFYKGKISRWRDCFTEEISNEFAAHCQFELDLLGYSEKRHA